MQQRTEKSSYGAGWGEAQEATAMDAEVRVGLQSEESLASKTLMEEILSRDNLRQAVKRVKANKGAPGIDKMTVQELPAYLRANWDDLREQLLSGKYKPRPVRRVEIPKPAGGTRKLGIPCCVDRFIQQAVLQVLQRYFDRTFSDNSYGFRPGRSAHQAVSKAQSYIKQGYMDHAKKVDSHPYVAKLTNLASNSSGLQSPRV